MCFFVICINRFFKILNTNITTKYLNLCGQRKSSTAMMSKHTALLMLYVSHYSLGCNVTHARNTGWARGLRPQQQGRDGLKQQWRWIKAGQGLGTQGLTAGTTEDTCPVRRYIWMRAEFITRMSYRWVFVLWTARGRSCPKRGGGVTKHL